MHNSVQEVGGQCNIHDKHDVSDSLTRKARLMSYTAPTVLRNLLVYLLCTSCVLSVYYRVTSTPHAREALSLTKMCYAVMRTDIQNHLKVFKAATEQKQRSTIYQNRLELL